MCWLWLWLGMTWGSCPLFHAHCMHLALWLYPESCSSRLVVFTMSICVDNNQLSAAVQCVLIIVSYSFCFVWDCQCIAFLAFSVELRSFSYHISLQLFTMTASKISSLVHWFSSPSWSIVHKIRVSQCIHKVLIGCWIRKLQSSILRLGHKLSFTVLPFNSLHSLVSEEQFVLHKSLECLRSKWFGE